jgi:uncharacterized protein YqhQ
VYLTTGYISAGAGSLALVLTGMTIALLHIGGQTASQLLYLLSVRLHLNIAESVFEGLGFLLFLLGFRLIPLSGIHAAEHKVVHAIERGEDLNRENVRRMPRVHPRCGTNLAVGAILLTTIIFGGMQLGQDKEGRLLFDPSLLVIVALITTFFLWRPLGSFAQKWFTTSEPTDKQIDMGIRSGEELLKRYATGPGGRHGFFARLWNTGLFHVMAGSTLVLGLLYIIQMLFPHLTIPGMN